MARRRRWTPKLEDEIRRTIFEGQLDITGAAAPREQILPPAPPLPARMGDGRWSDDIKDLLVDASEQPSLFD